MYISRTQSPVQSSKTTTTPLRLAQAITNSFKKLYFMVKNRLYRHNEFCNRAEIHNVKQNYVVTLNFYSKSENK